MGNVVNLLEYKKLRDAIRTVEFQKWNDAFSISKFFYKLNERLKEIKDEQTRE